MIRLKAACLSLAAAVTVALLLLILHFVKPEFDPSWRFLSEYAIGRNGWLMAICFQIWALSCIALFVALKDEVISRAGRIGTYLLLVVAAALAVAGLFAQDPVTATPNELTPHGSIHAAASLIGIPGIPLAAMLISRSLTRDNPAWAAYRRPIQWLAHLTWISLAIMAAYLAYAVPLAGGFNAEVWAGWMNRFVVATYLAWQMAIAYRIWRSP
jgi:amino acid permease